MAILKRVVDKPIGEMTSKDLERIIQSGCKDEELIQRIKSFIKLSTETELQSKLTISN